MCVFRDWGWWGFGGKEGKVSRVGDTGIGGEAGGWVLTGAHVDFKGAHAVVSGRTVEQALPVLPHPLSPQKQEELGLAVHTAVVPGAHRAAFTDGVASIASCRTNTDKVINKTEGNAARVTQELKELSMCVYIFISRFKWCFAHQLL